MNVHIDPHSLHTLKAIAIALSLSLSMSLPAWAGVVLVVAANSPLESINKEQAAQLFTGKSAVLPNGTQAVLIQQVEGAAVRDEFYDKIAGKNASQVKAMWSRLVFSGAAAAPKTVSDDTAVKKAVAEAVGAIGYIDKSAVDASVKVLLSAD